MSISHRLWDDAGFGIAETDQMIPVVADLLGRLGLSDAPRDEQVAGIEKWLSSHTPSRNLLRSIERHGYADALTAEQHRLVNAG